jgi:hypothetical protein
MGMPTNCQTEMRETVSSAVDSWPSFQKARRNAPERVEHELPDEADDNDRQHGRQEDERAIDAAADQPRQAEQHGESQADAVLHHHVNGEENQVVAERVPELARPVGICQECLEILETDEAAHSRLVARIKAQSDRVDQRIDREQGVDRKRRRQEHSDMDREARAGRHRVRRLNP